MRTKEQERLRQARRRERWKAGEWFASIHVDRRGFIECLILHGLLDADTRHAAVARTGPAEVRNGRFGQITVGRR